MHNPCPSLVYLLPMTSTFVLPVTAKFLRIKTNIIIHTKFIRTNNVPIITYIPHKLKYCSLFSIYCTFIFHITFIKCLGSTNNWTKITNTSKLEIRSRWQKANQIISCNTGKNCISMRTDIVLHVKSDCINADAFTAFIHHSHVVQRFGGRSSWL
jgi:hypothetical protein